MFTVKELKEFLKNVSDDTVVIINREAVISPILKKGRFRDDNFFSHTEKGNVQALEFLHHTESSDGVWGLTTI